MAARSLRHRLVKGVRAQVAGHVIRVVVQVGGVSILAGVWGLNLYGEWLILAAVPTYLTFSDIGLFAAASNDMMMKVGQNDRGEALRVFQTVSSTVTVLFGILALVLPVIAISAPLEAWLNLSTISEGSAQFVLIILGLNTLLIGYAGVLYGGFACEGHYGEGALAMSLITLVEFGGLALVVLLGGGPGEAAGAMFGARLLTTLLMYRRMRHHAAWLRLGRASGTGQVLRRLFAPALASAAVPTALALNVQGMIILIGVVLGPASAAIFSTLRTLSRVVIQLAASVFAVIAPEISVAFSANDVELLRTLHRRGCQAVLWIIAPPLFLLAIVGNPLIETWTSGAVQPQGPLLWLFLAVAGLASFWYTSFAVMFATNRHQTLAAYYMVASALALPLAYALLKVWALYGAAVSLVLLEIFMVFVVLRVAIPAAGDTWRGWLRAVFKPPTFLAGLASFRPEGRAP